MKDIKVLWLSNSSLLKHDTAGTGSWLSPFANQLADTGCFAVGNIVQGPVSAPTHERGKRIDEWMIPRVPQSSYQTGKLPHVFIENVTRIVRDFSPDLIHVWGTESIWGLLTARKNLNKPVLLEMQGIKQSISRVYTGNLSFREQLACIGIKELIKRKTIFQDKRHFAQWSTFENEIIGGHDFIGVQSTWLDAQVTAINPHCQIFQRDFILRPAFYTSEPWSYPENKIIFCSASYPSPFKGLHIIIRALAILKERFPDIQLRIAGTLQKTGLRQDGYMIWLNRQAEKLNVTEHITWLGGLEAPEIVHEMKQAFCMVLPTFIEGYSLATAEAANVGLPVVAAYVGGIPSFVQDEETALFFSPGDERMCAYQLGRLLLDKSFAENIGRKAQEIARRRNEPKSIIQQQIDIYRQVITNQ